MGTFDIVTNFIEAFISFYFIYYLFHKRKGIVPLLLFVSLKAINTTIHNYYALPEMSSTVTSTIIIYLYTCFLNKNHVIQNIFLILLINVIVNISTTLGMLISLTFSSSPFKEEYVYIALVIIVKTISIILLVLAYYFINKTEILSIKTKKLYSVLTSFFLLDVLYCLCIDYIYYDEVFNNYMISIIILINVLTLYLCFIFFESQKEQKELLKLQKRELQRQNSDKIRQINQNNVLHLERWKHDMKYVFSFLETNINEKNYEQSLDAIHLYSSILSQYNLFHDLKNDILNSVLIDYYENIINNNIHIVIGENKEENPINEDDLQSIFNSFMKQAVLYCSSTYRKEISIFSSSSLEYFLLTLQYTCINNQSHFNQSEIQQIIHRYQGLLKMDNENENFILRLMIPKRNET
ncbi:hypothetical protein [Candidatus Stoquefichus sp. SB1]|uniref:hypothetical protein n=1 Tax=Candidatus Stoquefichus sp. SB1 TaxID=1658109 RepID=UPI00067E678A|nr:hypothetical protein [Candidatus Stoquefichus sp. SB1]